MEYCAVQGPFNPLLDTHAQRFDVHKDVGRGLCIAAIHDAYVGKDREGVGPVHKLFNLRANLLIPYILDALGAKPTMEDIKPALEIAFQRVDEQVKSEAEKEASLKGFDWPPVYLATRLNSVVVILHDGWVYIAGATDAFAFLARDGAPVYLTSASHQIAQSTAILYEELPDCGSEPTLFYFHQERIQAEDEYLVVASNQLRRYVHHRDDILPVLQSRIDAEGLKEACKSMVGRFKDQSKILIVITIQEHAHEAKPRNKVARLEGASDIAMKDAMKDAMKELLNTEKYDIENDCFVQDPLRFLLPYVNGKKQCPEPQTSSEYYAFHNIQRPCPEEEIQIVSSL